ncbi:MAG TPA: hypothetical protein VLX30_06140 [Burkholderiales bacterium]|nr:hypothetical protein [Burkholderiales bacterium]
MRHENSARSEKGGGSFHGIKLLLCENPLPPLEEAIAAAQAEAPRGNHYTEAHSAPLRALIAEQLGVPERLVHINAGSELILRKLFDRLGERVHLLTPTYPLLPEIARAHTETRLSPADDLNRHNDAYPLARPSQAAAIAMLQHEDKIRARGKKLRAWTEALAGELRALGVRCHPSETYFFLADFAPHDARFVAALRELL